MSSAVSLVPTSEKQKTTKKRRPAFRPGNKSKVAKSTPAPPKPSAAPTDKPDENIAPDDPSDDPVLTTVVVEEAPPPSQDEEQLAQAADTSITRKPSTLITTTAPRGRKSRRKAPVKIATSSRQRSEKAKQKDDTPAAAANNNTTTNTSATGGNTTTTNTIIPATSSSLAGFCSKYRSTRKQKKDQPQTPAPVPPPLEHEATPAGPQVQIVDGEIVLQESSLVVPTQRKTVQEVEEEYQQVVEEEGHTSIVGASYNSFVTRRKPQHWSVDETKLFYNTLRQVGTDFATMEAFFKNRTRKQLKKKYQIETTKNPRLIELALDPKNKIPVDLSVFNVDKSTIKVVPSTPIVIDLNPTTEAESKTIDENEDSAPTTNTTGAAAATGTAAAANNEEVATETPLMVGDNDEHGFEAAHQAAAAILGFGDDGLLEDAQLQPAEEQPANEQPAHIPLAPNAAGKAKSKRPKFRAGKRKGGNK